LPPASPGDAVFVRASPLRNRGSVALAKAEPIFVDVDAETYNIDIDSLERRSRCQEGRPAEAEAIIRSTCSACRRL